MSRQFVVIDAPSDQKIAGIVEKAFRDGGKVPLKDLENRLVKGVGYQAFSVHSEDNPDLKEYHRVGYSIYEVRGGIVYKYPRF